MTTMSIPTNLPALPDPDAVEADDFAPRAWAGGDRDTADGGTTEISTESGNGKERNALHRIFTEEDDIWHEIMLEAWIFDTLSLRQTCHTLHSLSHHRVLWCKFLRRFCYIHGIPPATYTLEHMTARQIEGVVTRPYQFEKRLSVDRPLPRGASSARSTAQQYPYPRPNPARSHNTRGIGTGSGYKSTLLSLDTSSFCAPTAGVDLSLDDVVETTALVRGGRFLVALHDRHWLSCWDLWGSGGVSAFQSEEQKEDEEGVEVGREEEQQEESVKCKSIGTWRCESRVMRILAQQSADDENTLIIAVYCQSEADAGELQDNLVILRLNLAPPSSNATTASTSTSTSGFAKADSSAFQVITSTTVNVPNRACWTLDGDYVLVAGVHGSIAIWDWAHELWGVARLTLGENDGTLGNNAGEGAQEDEDLRAARYPRITMVSSTLFAVNYATSHGLSTHFLCLPPFYSSLGAALARPDYSQVARVGLSLNYLVGVFLPSWRPCSRHSRGEEQGGEGLVQMLIWNDVRTECVGRYVALRYTEGEAVIVSDEEDVESDVDSVELGSENSIEVLPSSSGADDGEDDHSSSAASSDASSDISLLTSSLASMSISPPPAPAPSRTHPRNIPGDIFMHTGQFVTLPRPGLFDETVRGQLACVGCEGEVARSQIIDGPLSPSHSPPYSPSNLRRPGRPVPSRANSAYASDRVIGGASAGSGGVGGDQWRWAGVGPKVVLGRCSGVKEFSYMDCWSGVLGVAELVEGGMTLRTFVF